MIESEPMRAALKAGASYFLVVFALGFLLGTVRVLLVEPRLGRLAATLIELPIMLLASWLACHWALRKFNVAGTIGARLIMALLAFLLLMTAEALLGLLAFDMSLAQQIAMYRDAAPLLGLIGQGCFAALPLVIQRHPV